MCESISISSFQKNGLRMSFIILCSLFIFENTFSIKKWDVDYVSIMYNKLEKSITMACIFFDYEFGAFGEHGYLEYADIEFSPDGTQVIRLMSCQVNDQVYDHVNDQVNGLTAYTFVNVKNKLPGAKIEFINSYWPKSGYVWLDIIDTFPLCYSNNGLKQFPFTIKWFPTSYSQVAYISLNGRWHVNGLYYCTQDIVSQKYFISYEAIPKRDVLPDLQQKRIVQSALKVFSEGDALIINGAERGENIRVYTTSGTFVKSLVADEELVYVKLPANQVYIVQLKQTRYKVAV